MISRTAMVRMMCDHCRLEAIEDEDDADKPFDRDWVTVRIADGAPGNRPEKSKKGRQAPPPPSYGEWLIKHACSIECALELARGSRNLAPCRITIDVERTRAEAYVDGVEKGVKR